MRVIDRMLRVMLTGVHQLLKLGWFVRRPRTYGAHALALTPERKIVLVKLRYAAGWRLPGGGRTHDEPADQAVLRELREEIGMRAHGAVRFACELDEETDFKRDLASLLVVDEVRYSPRRWSWEVEQVIEADLDRLPDGMSPRSLRWIAAVRPHI
jgi:ADP-ribose pyrophosphatase YjhB (NUDIX family)